MGNKIHKLDKQTIGQIAAGEVVERPASAIKEMVENSIDSGADKIIISVSENCRDIMITDNGSGMSEDDLSLAFEPFATSKIEKIDDLDNLHSYGFRGEALASIASVSKLKCVSNPDNSPHYINIEGSQITDKGSCAGNKGTSIIIKELFYNTPARLKFLKSAATEFSHIYSLVQSMALVNNHISFELIYKNRPSLTTHNTTNKLDTISNLFSDMAGDLLPVDYQMGGIQISGYIGRPDKLTRSNKSSQYIYVNNRMIRNSTISKAMQDAFIGMIPDRANPVAFIFINMQPDQFDINCHPTKQEVRFANNQAIYKVVRDAIMNGLVNSGKTMSPYSNEAESTSYDNCVMNNLSDNNDYVARNNNQAVNKPTNAPGYNTTQRQSYSAQPAYTQAALSHTITTEIANIPKFVGILDDTYILFIHGAKLLIMDFHVAHERILFDYLTHKKISSQGLLIPIPIKLNAQQREHMSEYLPTLKEAGFEIEGWRDGEYIVRAIPSILKPSMDIQSIIEYVVSDENGDGSDAISSLKNEIYERLACRAAVKAGTELNHHEVEKLARSFFETKLPYTCPHGRPIVIEMTSSELGKMFLRG